MKNLLLLLISSFLINAPLFAKTEFSQFIEYVQKKYADKFQAHPILILDQDELDFLYAKEKAFGEEDEQERKRSEILQKYIFDKTGVELSSQDSFSIEPYTSVLKSGAFALPLVKRNSNPIAYNICLVFPASPNSNQRLETERITGLKTPGAYEDVTYTGLQEKMTFKELQYFSLYHELGHCMDTTFMPENYGMWDPDAHSIYQSENFAEVFALFVMEREGLSGTGKTRALLRNMYAQRMGRWFVDNPGNAFGNPNYLKGGMIYWLTPTLLVADRMIEEEGESVYGDIEKLMKTTEDIVNQFALDGRSFHAIFSTFDRGEEAALETYRDYAFDSPEYFEKAYKEMVHFLDFSPFLLTLMEGNTPDQNGGRSLSPLTLKEICEKTNQEALEALLDESRNELKSLGTSYESQLDYRKHLESFFETLSHCTP